MKDVLLRVQLQAGYGRVQVLEDVHFELHRGEALGLIGTSGAGKSTLVLALLALLPWRGGFAAGEVELEGENLLVLSERNARAVRGKTIALVPQSPAAALNGAISLRKHFEQAWLAHEKGNPKGLETRLRTLLSEVQLPSNAEFLARKPGQISVGQGQRILIALALLHRPALIVADEPTSALDPVTQAEILALLHRLNREGTALLYISHDLLSVLELCQRVAVLDKGRIAECLPVFDIEKTAKHPASLALLHSLPVPPAILRQHREAIFAQRQPDPRP